MSQPPLRAVAVALALACLAPPAAADEAEQSLVELGPAAGGGWFPDYPAAGQKHWQGISARQLQGSRRSSSVTLIRSETTRSSPSGSHACGLAPRSA